MENGYEGFHIDYQPIVSTRDNEITGAEALLRIKDNDSYIMPAEFLPLAEYLGFMIPIGEYVLENSSLQCLDINSSGLPDFKVTVNISARQVSQDNILANMEKILAKAKAALPNIILSFSEKTVLEDVERATILFRRLKDMGVSLALDDFGGGSASLLQLHKIPIDYVTTSTVLMDSLDEEYTREHIGLIVKLCHSSGKKVCINGIETPQQYNYSKNCGADHMQGVYLHEAQGPGMLKSLIF
jgi:EAL domain-containing protein (putative c-di-GMP-specific phosphodiesterase class I)